MSPSADADARFMALALRLAERGLGCTWPNPAVGCVVVKDGRILGRGWTRPPPGAHAEVEALRRAGAAAMGATCYVTLEPCAHYGRTPPCTMALIHAGVRRVVVALQDPFPRVDGRGIEQLRQAGIQVELGLGAAAAADLNAGFFLKVQAGRPLVTLKLATSLDGKLATRTGASQWLTGEAARARGQRFRASHDAILIGSGTALADDPALTCRLPGLAGRSPVRVVLDGRLRLPLASQLVTAAPSLPCWVVTTPGAPREAAEPLRRAGVELIEVAAEPAGGLAPLAVLQALAARGITRLLIEGGAAVATSFLRARLVDRIAWFRAPMVLGNDAQAAVGSLAIDALAEALQFQPGPREGLASDDLATYTIGKP